MYPGRAQKHTPLIDSTSTPPPFAGRLVGRMHYAPTLPAEKLDLKGLRGVMFRRRGDSSIRTITMEEFQSDIERFLDLSEEEAVVITRDNGKPIKIEAINSDDFLRYQAERCTP